MRSAAGCRLLTPVIPATYEEAIRRIAVGSQPGQIVLKTLSRKYPSQKRAGGVKWLKVWSLSSNPSTAKKKKKKKRNELRKLGISKFTASTTKS
jgi:hypothetical protein